MTLADKIATPENWRMMRRAAARIVGDDLAQDAAQDAMAKAMELAPKLPEGANVKAWLRGRAKFAAFSLLRAEAAQRKYDCVPPGLPPAESPADTSERLGRLAYISTSLDALTEIQRQAFDARMDGLSFAQAADETGATQGSLRKAMFRAREALRLVLR